MNHVALVDHVRAEAEADASPEQRAQRIADLVRTRTGRHWVGVYRVDPDEVVNLAWRTLSAPRTRRSWSNWPRR
jgi:hypothetical protein